MDNEASGNASSPSSPSPSSSALPASDSPLSSTHPWAGAERGGGSSAPGPLDLAALAPPGARALHHTDRLYCRSPGGGADLWFTGWFQATYWGRFLCDAGDDAPTAPEEPGPPTGAFQVTSAAGGRICTVVARARPGGTGSYGGVDPRVRAAMASGPGQPWRSAPRVEVDAAAPVRRWAPGHPAHAHVVEELELPRAGGGGGSSGAGGAPAAAVVLLEVFTLVGERRRRRQLHDDEQPDGGGCGAQVQVQEEVAVVFTDIASGLHWERDQQWWDTYTTVAPAPAPRRPPSLPPSTSNLPPPACSGGSPGSISDASTLVLHPDSHQSPLDNVQRYFDSCRIDDPDVAGDDVDDSGPEEAAAVPPELQLGEDAFDDDRMSARGCCQFLEVLTSLSPGLGVACCCIRGPPSEEERGTTSVDPEKEQTTETEEKGNPPTPTPSPSPPPSPPSPPPEEEHAAGVVPGDLTPPAPSPWLRVDFARPTRRSRLAAHHRGLLCYHASERDPFWPLLGWGHRVWVCDPAQAQAAAQAQVVELPPHPATTAQPRGYARPSFFHVLAVRADDDEAGGGGQGGTDGRRHFAVTALVTGRACAARGALATVVYRSRTGAWATVVPAAGPGALRLRDAPGGFGAAAVVSGTGTGGGRLRDEYMYVLEDWLGRWDAGGPEEEEDSTEEDGEPEEQEQGPRRRLMRLDLTDPAARSWTECPVHGLAALDRVCPAVLADPRGRLLLQGAQDPEDGEPDPEDGEVEAHRTPCVWEVADEGRGRWGLRELASVGTAAMVEVRAVSPAVGWFCVDGDHERVYFKVDREARLLVLEWGQPGSGGLWYWMPESPVMLAACGGGDREQVVRYDVAPLYLCPPRT